MEDVHLSVGILLCNFNRPVPGATTAVQYSPNMAYWRKYEAIVEYQVKDLLLKIKSIYIILRRSAVTLS
jgi:hypothetical protein